MTKIQNPKPFRILNFVFRFRYCFGFRNSNLGFDQKGVTLVISMIMLGTVTFISFSLAAIILREIKTARLILASEPAISGANAGGEVGIYKFIRSLGNVGVANPPLPQSGAAYQVAPDLYDDPFPYTVDSQKTINVGLYDAENINNQTSRVYGSVQIFLTAGGPVRVTVYSWSTPTGPVAGCDDRLLTFGTSPLTCTPLNGADKRYVVSIVDQNNGATGNVKGFAPDASPLGVPSDAPVLDVTSTSGKTERKIRIKF